MWSNWCSPVTTGARMFCTSCSLSMLDCDMPASSAMQQSSHKLTITHRDTCDSICSILRYSCTNIDDMLVEWKARVKSYTKTSDMIGECDWHIDYDDQHRVLQNTNFLSYQTLLPQTCPGLVPESYEVAIPTLHQYSRLNWGLALNSCHCLLQDKSAYHRCVLVDFNSLDAKLISAKLL